MQSGKNYIRWATFLLPKVSVYLQPLFRNAPERSTDFSEITQSWGLGGYYAVQGHRVW